MALREDEGMTMPNSRWSYPNRARAKIQIYSNHEMHSQNQEKSKNRLHWITYKNNTLLVTLSDLIFFFLLEIELATTDMKQS